MVQRQRRAGFGEARQLVVMRGEQQRLRLVSWIASATAQASASPSYVEVPRPTSSRITKLRSVAWARIAAVSTISTMNVERPRARFAEAPTRLTGGRQGPA